MYMKKLLIILFFLLVPALSFADSSSSISSYALNIGFGNPKYSDSLVGFWQWDGTEGNWVSGQPTTDNYTIVSLMGVVLPGVSFNGNIFCQDQNFVNTTIFPVFNLGYYTDTQQFLSLNSNQQIHCSGDFGSDLGTSPLAIMIQYVPYDTRNESATTDGTISYYDWLIVMGIIIFILSLFVFYPVIEDLFIHKKHNY